MRENATYSCLFLARGPQNVYSSPRGGNFLGLLIVDAELKQILLIALLPARWKTVKGWK